MDRQINGTLRKLFVTQPSPREVLTGWIMPNPNTTSQLIKEAPSPADAKPGPKSKGTELGQQARAVCGARSRGAGTDFPPARPDCGSHSGIIHPEAVPEQHLALQDAHTPLGKSEAISNGYISPNQWVLWQFPNMHTQTIFKTPPLTHSCGFTHPLFHI